MKKIFTLLLSSLFSLSLLAYDGSRLSISAISKNSTDLKVEIDGRKYILQENSITISNLSAGNHQVKIYREKQRKGNGNGFGSARKKQEIIYASNVYLKRGFHLDITINRFGKALVDEREIGRNGNSFDDDGYYDDIDDGGWDDGYANGMNAQDFALIKQTISKEWMESGRLISVRTVMDKNSFTSQQVKELMLLFSFENNKLEVAKYGYRKTVDKENYFLVNEALGFKSSRDELARFIRESR